MKYLLTFIFFASFLSAQNLDSLFNNIISLQEVKVPGKELHSITATSPPAKCGFGIISDAKRHFDEFTSNQQNKIQNILSRPERETSIVSPSGIFRIHYDRTGYDAPNYFNGIKNTVQLSVDSLAIALDSSYNYEVNVLGYKPPPSDGTDGGDDLYDVYIAELGSGYYGWTDYESIGNGVAKSYMVIDNSFDTLHVSTNGIYGARVTAAHEFHHAIQVGSYRMPLDGDNFYFEITSTSMEEFVYDSINDYYSYLPYYFKNPDRRFTYFDGSGSGGGYDRVIWNIFLKEKFEYEEANSTKGFDIIKRTWELMNNLENSAMKSISLALSENGLSLKDTFAEFAQWTFFTNHRAKPNKYFSEASEYNLIKPIASYQYQPPKKTYMMTSQPMSNNFIFFDLSYSGINDTLYSIITNCDDNSSELQPYAIIEYDYSILTSEEDGSKEIFVDEFKNTSYYSKTESNKIEYLKESNVFNNKIVNGTTITREEINYAYPQPFNTTKYSFVCFPTKLNVNNTAKLIIYSTNMNLVYNREKKLENDFGKIVVRWDGIGNNGKSMASGIYIFVTESNGKLITGKIAIIN